MIECWSHADADRQIESDKLAVKDDDEKSEGAPATLCGLLGFVVIAAPITLGIAVVRALAGN
jgi:hypothetical protein